MTGEENDVSVVAAALFRHNTWANLKLLDFCAGLPDAQLDEAAAAGVYGSVRDTCVHYIGAEVDYVNLASGKLPDCAFPRDQFPGFDVLMECARWSGAAWLKLATGAQADRIVRVARPGEPVYEYPLAGLAVQVINHAAEHRTQIAAVLTRLGIEPPALSGWAHMRAVGEFKTIPG